jgi:histidine triad (HIT) family protein
MPTIFTRIIEGELPGHFVYRDDVCVAFMSIAPLTTGHTLVVPIAEVDHWIDLDEATVAHLMKVSQRISSVIDDVYSPAKVGLMIAGLEVPHVHIHLVPINAATDLDFANASSVPSEELAAAANKIHTGLNL